MPAGGLTCLGQDTGRAVHISHAQLQACKKHLNDNEPVDNAIILPNRLQALSPVLLGSIEVVPFV